MATLGGVPLMDFSIIGDLPKTIREGRKARREEDLTQRREATLAELGQGASVGDVARKLFQAGDIQGGLSLAQLGNAQAQQEWNRTYQGGMLDIARKTADRKEVPQQVQVLQAAGIDPQSPEGRKALFPKTDTPISATDKKAIFEAEDEIPQLQGTMEALTRAKELNSKTFTGLTAGLRGTIATKVPGGSAVFDKNAGLATEEWSKIMGPEALQVMANTLKGATTDFELRTYIGMLADPSTDPKVREKVIDRMQKLAERKMKISQSRTKDLRSGSYFKPEGGPASAPQGEGGLPRVTSPAEAAKLPKGTRFIDPNGVERIVP